MFRINFVLLFPKKREELDDFEIFKDNLDNPLCQNAIISWREMTNNDKLVLKIADNCVESFFSRNFVYGEIKCEEMLNRATYIHQQSHLKLFHAIQTCGEGINLSKKEEKK